MNCIPEQVHTSTSIVDHLFQHQIPVPRVLRNTYGELVTSLQCPEGIRYAVVSERIRGQEPDIFDDRDALTIGRLVGRMYRVLDDLAPEGPYRSIDQTALIQSALDDIHRYLPDEEARIGYLVAIGRRLWEVFEEYAAHQAPQYGVCHGDLHTGNMLKTPGGDIYLFDFDACGRGWRVYDIGVYANDDWTKTARQELDRDRDALQRFLRGYTEYSSLTADEYRLFPLMLGIRHFELFGLVLRTCVFLEGSHWIEGSLRFHHEWFKAWESSVDWSM